MSQPPWPNNEANEDLDPLGALFAEWSDPEDEEEEFREDFFRGLAGRRRKAAFVLMAVWGATISLYFVSWGSLAVLALAGVMFLQILRLLLAQPQAIPAPLNTEQLATAPLVSLMVAAKNEEAVIAKLAKQLCALDYPQDRLEVWIVDDRSTDRTPQILDVLIQEHQQLRVLHRPAGATGGKSGALNQVFPLTKGEIVAVFDADAQVPQDLLRRVLPLFDRPEMGAVQVRKQIANADTNLWTRGQRAEMALDSYFQQQRLAIGGLGELRGNGQFARRTALERCGGWNEETITDDLDLTIRLHLDGWEIGFLPFPAVSEEGVTNIVSLWHQRNRWAEGGYQRYLDYWRLLASNRMGWRKSIDLLFFLLFQYLLPTAAIADLVMSAIRHRLGLLTPLTGLLISVSCWGMFSGLRRISVAEGKGSLAQLPIAGLQTLRGTLYMLHWLVVIASTTARMSIRPKRLKWVKTVHQGTGEERFV